MNQSFKKKAIAASLASAFVLVGAGVVSLPGVETVKAAQANQFADTTQAVAITAGVNVPALASAALTGQSFSITENVGSAISTGYIIFELTNGAKFVSATATATKTSGTTGFTLEPVEVSSGKLKVPVSTSTSADVVGGKITLTAITLDTSAVTVGNTVSVSISSSSTTTGLTTGVSSLLGTVASYGATVARSSTTVSDKASGAVQTMDQVNITEAILGSLYTAPSDGATITVELQGGYTWTAKPTLGTVSGDNKLNGANANTAGSYTGSSTTKAVYRLEDTTDSAAATVLSLASGTVFIPAGTAAAPVTAIVTVNRGSSALSQTTVTLFNVASKTTTNSFVEASGTTATVDYNTLYAGRNYATGIDGGVTSTGATGEADKVKIAESLAGSLVVGGTVTLTLSNGAEWGATDGTAITGDNAAQTNSLNLGQEVVSATTPTLATYTVTAASTGSPDSDTLTLVKLDLTRATVGDLNVSFAGNAGGASSAVKVADIKNASGTSVSGATSTVTGGTVFTAPDIVITETVAGAIPATDDLLIELPVGYVIQMANGSDASDTGALTNNTDVTVTATNSSGTAVSSFITSIKANDVTNTGTVRQLAIDLASASTSSTGPYTYKISGLKVKAPAGAAAGDVNALVGSAPNSATPAALDTTKSATGATKASVKVGGVVSATVPVITATATGGNTALTMSGSVVASGNDQGKIGTLFVVAVMQNGQVYSRDSAGGWTLWDGVTAFKSVSAGVTLGTHSVSILSTATNVSTIVGTQVYLGYGIGALGNSAYNNLLANATYAKVYTVQ